MKVIVVTGSTRGIGYGLADAFLARGCAVVVSGRNQQSVDTAVQQLSQTHDAGRIFGQPCDMQDYDQVQALWDRTRAHFGHVDIWINNAGLINESRPVWQQDPARMAAVVNTNLTGLLYAAKVVIHGMAEQGYGHMYNMEGSGSDGAIRAGLTPYGMTKYGVRYLTRALIKETAATPVKISTLSPGMVITEMLVGQYDDPAEFERVKRFFNILADDVATVSPWLADRVLANDKAGANIAWLTTPKIAARFLSAPFRKRDLFQNEATS